MNPFWTSARAAIALTFLAIATGQVSAAVFDLTGPTYLAFTLTALAASAVMGVLVYVAGRQEDQ